MQGVWWVGADKKLCRTCGSLAPRCCLACFHACTSSLKNLDISPSNRLQDYAACKWPDSLAGAQRSGHDSVAEWADGLNDTPAALPPGCNWQQLMRAATAPGTDVASFSHFLPLQALMPEKRYLM